MGGVSVAVAQAMRYAGCPNRRSLGVSDVFPHEIDDWKLVGICFWRLRRWLLRAAAAWATSRASLGLPRCTWTTSMTLSRDVPVAELPAVVLRGLSRPQRRDATGADWRE